MNSKAATKYYLTRLWLAISVSFYLFVPYLSRFVDEFNRFCFHWNHWHLLSLLLSIFVVGLLFFLAFILLYVRKNKLTRNVFEILFIAIAGISVVANILHYLKILFKLNGIIITRSSPLIHKIAFQYTGYPLLVLWGIFVAYACFKKSGRIKNLCMALCFILSPALPIFFCNALTYSTIDSGSGTMPIVSRGAGPKFETEKNVYIFVFDEWSYNRSFNNRKLIEEFANLNTFKEQSVAFHRAYSPAPKSFTSIPALLFQANLRFTGKGDEFGFLDRNFIPISRFESIFHHPRELGYYTCLIGSHIPFGSFLGNSVDFCHSASHGPKFGYGFFDVFLYHLYGAAVRFPHDLAISKIGVIQGYVVNRWTVNLNNSIHERVRTIIQNEHLPAPTYALFHYNIPHPPFIYKREGHAKLFSRYEILSPSKYYGNLAYLDKIIGEIITALKKVGRFESSLIIMTSDHSWRFDPESIGTINQELCHVPLFIKFPYQKESIEIDSKFSTVKLGAIINQYLDGNFNFRKAKSILNAPDYYVAPLKWGGRGFKYTLKNIGQ